MDSSSVADILSKYSDIYPKEFVDCVRKGVSWLCMHNNIVYQSSLSVVTDKFVYNTPGNSVLRIGLIDTTNPLSGLTYYEVISVESSNDEVSGKIVFKLKTKYNTPMGISVTIIPIIHFDPEFKPNVYNKQEVDQLLKDLKIEELTAKVEELSTDLTTLRAAVDVVKTTVETVEASVETNTESITNVETDITAMKVDIQQAQEDIKDLEANINTVP